MRSAKRLLNTLFIEKKNVQYFFVRHTVKLDDLCISYNLLSQWVNTLNVAFLWKLHCVTEKWILKNTKQKKERNKRSLFHFYIVNFEYTCAGTRIRRKIARAKPQIWTKFYKVFLYNKREPFACYHDFPHFDDVMREKKKETKIMLVPQQTNKGDKKCNSLWDKMRPANEASEQSNEILVADKTQKQYYYAYFSSWYAIFFFSSSSFSLLSRFYFASSKNMFNIGVLFLFLGLVRILLPLWPSLSPHSSHFVSVFVFGRGVYLVFYGDFRDILLCICVR